MCCEVDKKGGWEKVICVPSLGEGVAEAVAELSLLYQYVESLPFFKSQKRLGGQNDTVSFLNCEKLTLNSYLRYVHVSGVVYYVQFSSN